MGRPGPGGFLAHLTVRAKVLPGLPGPAGRPSFPLHLGVCPLPPLSHPGPAPPLPLGRSDLSDLRDPLPVPVPRALQAAAFPIRPRRQSRHLSDVICSYSCLVTSAHPPGFLAVSQGPQAALPPGPVHLLLPRPSGRFPTLSLRLSHRCSSLLHFLSKIKSMGNSPG